MMAVLFFWTVVMFVWWQTAGYDYAIKRNHWLFGLYRFVLFCWLIYGTYAVTFILWSYLP